MHSIWSVVIILVISLAAGIAIEYSPRRHKRKKERAYRAYKQERKKR